MQSSDVFCFVLCFSLLAFLAYQHQQQQQRHHAASLIQSYTRQYLHRLHMQRDIQQRTYAAITLQKIYRSHHARTIANKRRYVIAWIQCHWRGYYIRRYITPQMRAVRTRIATATATAIPAMTVATRTKSALEILLSSKQLSVVTKACQTLDAVS